MPDIWGHINILWLTILVKLFSKTDTVNNILDKKKWHDISFCVPYLSIQFLEQIAFLTEKVSHQGALLGKSESRLRGHDHNEGEEAENVNKAATETGNVGLVEEGAD